MPVYRTRTESALVIFTVAVLVIYAPLETWISFPRLLSLYYLVDAIGLALLLAGVVMWRRTRITYAAVLAAGYGWLGANYWRGMALRLAQAYDAREWPEQKIVEVGSTGVAVGGAVLIGLCAVGVILAIAVTAQRDRQR